MKHEKSAMSRHFIRFSILSYIAFNNLIRNKLRTGLTVFGIMIGISAIFFLTSFGLGLQNLVTEQVIGDKSIKAIDVTSPSSRVIQLDNKSVEKLSNLGSVQKVGRSYSFPGSITHAGAEFDVVTYGVDENYQNLSSLNISAGRLLQNTDTKEMVVNRAGLTSLGIKFDKAALGQKIKMSVPISTGADAKKLSDEFTIVGVIDSGAGGEVFIPRGRFDAIGVASYSSIKVVVDDVAHIPALRKQIESLGFQSTSPVDTLDQINEIFKIFTIILASFGAIGMVVSVLGMFNTLTISLLERTQEIGLMMSMGARNRDIRILFIIEALILSIAGAVIGIIVAVISGKLVNLALNLFAQQRGITGGFDLFATPLWLMLAMIAFMVVVGSLVVYFPAKRAATINPVEALGRD